MIVVNWMHETALSADPGYLDLRVMRNWWHRIAFIGKSWYKTGPRAVVLLGRVKISRWVSVRF